MADEKSVMVVIRAARPTFRNNNDKVAFAVHASFLSAGFVLTSTGRSSSLSSPSTDEVGIDNWNDMDDEYAFVYINPEEKNDKKKKVIVKCLVMNGQLLVDALGDGGSEPLHTQLNVGEYVSEEGGSGNYAAQYKNLDKLVKKLNEDIICKLDGSASKPSSENTSTDGSRCGLSEPDHVDIHEPTGPFVHPSGVVVPPVNPIGGSDLYPGPPAGVFPNRGGFGRGDMLLGPDDPFWTGGVGGRPGLSNIRPSRGVPPGARFDPYGPPDLPGFEPGRFMRRPGRGTHPDLEHFRDDSDFI